jgi:hypothetical protein
MGRRMVHGKQQKRNKSRGNVDDMYCFLCEFKAEDSDEFNTHLEELRHKYNFKLAEFKNSRSVSSVIYCPILFV